jgi:hypothetical protein
MQIFISSFAHHNAAPLFPKSRPNRGRECRRDSTQVSRRVRKGMGMTEQEERLAKERKEIAARVASFRATQEKFEREREEYFVTTLQNARGIKPIPFWS